VHKSIHLEFRRQDFFNGFVPPRRRSLNWRFERKIRPTHLVIVAGVDEVGRGCWAGPVFAAAAILPDGLRHKYLHDSKLVESECREELSEFLCTHPEVRWAVGIASLEEIELLNILRASLLAMRRAVAGLVTAPELCLIDGNMKAGLECEEVTVVDGDARCPSIAAASVIAKVARDRAMAELAVLYPNYGFEKHKGYGTPEHQRALALHGPSSIHRRAFRPIREHACAPVLDADGEGNAW
jgi:ribonuclease HII